MTDPENILNQLKKKTGFLSKAVAVITPIAIIVGGAVWYMNNIWRPAVALTAVDFEKKIATLTINGKTRVLYAGSTINAGFGWGVRFMGSVTDEYDRIELVKNELVYKTISKK